MSHFWINSENSNSNLIKKFHCTNDVNGDCTVLDARWNNELAEEIWNQIHTRGIKIKQTSIKIQIIYSMNKNSCRLLNQKPPYLRKTFT